MSNEDILLLVQELPLKVILTLKRGGNNYQISLNQSTSTPMKSNVNDSIISAGRITPNIASAKMPIGYALHSVFLSSIESKCIMPDDLEACEDAEGFYQVEFFERLFCDTKVKFDLITDTEEFATARR